MANEEDIEGLRECALDIKRRIDEFSQLEDFIDWFESSQDFAIVDISERSTTPMEMVDGKSVMEKYRLYLTEQLDIINDEIDSMD